MTSVIIRAIGFGLVMGIIILSYERIISLDFAIYLSIVSALAIFHNIECNWFNHKSGVKLTPTQAKLVRIGWKIETWSSVFKFLIIPVSILYVIIHFLIKYW